MLTNIGIAYLAFSVGIATVASLDIVFYLKNKMHYKCKILTHIASFLTFFLMSPFVFFLYVTWHEMFRYNYVNHIIQRDKEF